MADPDYLDLSLTDYLDRVAAATPALRRAYRRAMELELGFFDAAWGAGGTVAGQ